MKTLSPSTNGVINNSEEFKQFIPANFSYFLERSSGLIRRILQDMGQWADNSAHEKLLLRLFYQPYLFDQFYEYKILYQKVDHN